MVEVDGGRGAAGSTPTVFCCRRADFSPEEAESYPRIGEIHTAPQGPAGKSWGDAAVTGAAHLATAVEQDWHALGLFRIVPGDRKPGRQGAEYTFILFTHSGTQIFWGRAPRRACRAKFPPTKNREAQALRRGNNGSLDGPDGPHQIKIREDGAVVAVPRRKSSRCRKKARKRPDHPAA